MRILPLTKKTDFSTTPSLSVSVDCDALIHYLNFAPAGTTIDQDPYTYQRMCRILLRLFAKHQIQATFFCIADRLHDPEVVKVFQEIIKAGHVIGNHTLSHPPMDTLSEDAQLLEIQKGHETIQEKLSVVPIGYRAPAYYITEKGLGQLVRLGYRYDSSIFNASLSTIALQVLSFFRSDFTPKEKSSLHSRFSSSTPSLIEFPDHGRLIEWPIPVALGIGFFGTFHCFVPKPVFFIQKWMLNLYGNHIHYELHPIEVVTPECSKNYPWLPITHTKVSYLEKWMDTRLKSLVLGRKIVTLETLSEAYLHSLHG